MKQCLFGGFVFFLSVVSMSSAQANELVPNSGSANQYGPRIITSSFEHQNAAVRIIIKGGAFHEPSDKRGIARLTVAALLNPVVSKGDKNKIYDLDSRLQRLNAKVRYAVGTHATVISIDAPSVSVTEALALIVSNLTAPSLSEQSISDTLAAIRNEQFIHEPLDNYYSLQRALYPHLFSNGSESRNGISPSLKAKDVVNFYREKYQPRNMTFVATGGIAREGLEQVAKSRLLLPMVFDQTEGLNQEFTLTSTSPQFPLKRTEFGSVRQLTWGFKGTTLFEDPAVCMVLGELLRRQIEEVLEREIKMKFDVDGGYVLLPEQGYFSFSVRGGGWKGVIRALKNTSTTLSSNIRDNEIKAALSSLEKQRNWLRFHPDQLADQFVQHVLAGRIDTADYESLENELETVSRSAVESRAKELLIESNNFVVRFDPVQR